MKIKIREKSIWVFIIIALFAKILLFLYLKWFVTDINLFGGGNDSTYYHFYAQGYFNVAVNYWPIFLRFLYENGLYDKEQIILILFLTSLTILPYLYYKLIKVQTYDNKLVKAGSIFVIIFYPSIFFFTIDIFRDIVMIVILLICFLLYKNILEANKFSNIIYFLIYFSLAYLLFLFRKYMGFAVFLSPFIYLILLKTKTHIKTLIVVYFAILILFKNSGALHELLNYREGFGRGGTTIGIKLMNQNSIMFIFYYVYSLLTQLFGLFLVNITAIITFIFESLPFTFASIYLLKNLKFMSKFVTFLLTFFVIYTSIWLLGNDNLGTATRLRIPSYLVIFACMFIVYQTKIIMSLKSIKKNYDE